MIAIVFFLFLDEISREREFYRSKGLPCPKDIPPNPSEVDEEKSVADVHAESDYHRQDEQVNVCLECTSSNLKTLKRRFIRCSAQATILHLKKFVAKKVLNGMEKYRDVSCEFIFVGTIKVELFHFSFIFFLFLF